MNLIEEITSDMTWEIRHKVMWPHKKLDYVMLPNDEEGRHFGLFNAGNLVSVISVFMVEDCAQFRKFATLHEEQGKGYGSALLRHIFDELEGKNVRSIWCNARTSKIALYERFEMNCKGAVFSKDGEAYIKMERRMTGVPIY